MGDIRRHVRVSGRVQGVGFRWWTRAEADRLGVRGWVRNLADGTVEAELEGDPAAVSALLEVLRKGPTGAVVEGIEVSDRPPDGEPGFRITAAGGIRRLFGRGPGTGTR